MRKAQFRSGILEVARALYAQNVGVVVLPKLISNIKDTTREGRQRRRAEGERGRYVQAEIGERREFGPREKRKEGAQQGEQPAGS